MPRRLPTVGRVRPVFNRRQVLAGGAALAVVGMTGSACGAPPAPPAVDELEAQLTLARRDSELATAAAAAATPVSAALTEVAAERTQHAQALATEIARLAVSATSTSSQTSSPTTTTSAAAAPPPAVSDVINSLHASADSAAGLAATSSGYRAGLLGSIAAACTAAYSVALVSTGSAS